MVFPLTPGSDLSFPTLCKAGVSVRERRRLHVKPAEKYHGHFSFPISGYCFSSHFLTLPRSPASGPFHQLLAKDFRALNQGILELL